MLFDFLFTVESGCCILWIVDILSLYVYIGPMIGTPIIWSLYRSLRDASMPYFIAMNSAPNTALSTVAWCFVCHITHAMLMNIQNPVLDLCRILSLV